MSALWTSQDAAAATGGRCQNSWAAQGVSIDTRNLQKGDLFVALKDMRDGHDFVAQALEKGAAAALVSYVPEGVGSDAPLLIVEDVLSALEDLARAARARTNAKVIAITGSVGKTSTKDMLHLALQSQGKTHAAEKSYNNHWGVPLTLARMPKDTDFAIIEIGMNHPGEIAPLAKLARPDVALVTTVAPAHLEAFASVEEIAVEKASIFQGLSGGGLAIFNNDIATRQILADAAPEGYESFGASSGSDWHVQEISCREGQTICHARYNDETILFKISAFGQHFAMNGLAVLAASHGVGADLARAALALAQWHPPSGRGEKCFVSLDPAAPDYGITLFDDAYNANPASMQAALNVLASTPVSSPQGARIAIVGDMKELGPDAPTLHAEIAAYDAMSDLDKVHCVGPLMEALYEALPPDKRGMHVQTSDALALHVKDLIKAGDITMVKGSLSMKMALIVDAIKKLGHGRHALED